MKTLLSPDLDAQPLLLVDCEARSREALEKNLTRMGIRWHHLTGDEALPPLTPCAVLVELEAFASPLTLSQINLAGIPVIALTSHEGLYQVQRALELGATALLTKPITQRAIYTTLMMAVGLRQQLHDNNRCYCASVWQECRRLPKLWRPRCKRKVLMNNRHGFACARNQCVRTSRWHRWRRSGCYECRPVSGEHNE